MEKKHPWMDELPPGSHVTEKPTYPTGKYLDLFEERLYPGSEYTGQMRYYVFDPTLHGAPADGEYPVLFALHGMGAALHGRLAINWAAAEMFASPEYQKRMGGAYIVCPLANETGDPKNPMGWPTPLPGEPQGSYPQALLDAAAERPLFKKLMGRESIYTEPLFEILQEARASFACAGKTVLFGTSAGGYAAWRQLIAHGDAYCAAVLMAAAYVPTNEEMEKLRSLHIPLWLCHGRRDELVPLLEPLVPGLLEMEGVETYFPDFVRHGDHGISTNAGGGFEMGQHCINDAVHQNLIFDDGTPYDPAWPDGVTGWIRKHAVKA